MINLHFEDEIIENKQFTSDELKKRQYTNCTFKNCNFSEIQLHETHLSDCTFINCNLAMTKMAETQLANVNFDSCKIMGVNFKHCSSFLFEVVFKRCILDYSSFENLKMKKTIFTQCSMKGVDFSNTDLTEAQFIRCDLADAAFHSSNLKQADFTTSYSYNIDPNENYIKGAKFSLDGLPGLLVKFNIIIE